MPVDQLPEPFPPRRDFREGGRSGITDQDQLRNRIANVQERIDAAARPRRREREAITLVAVSKTWGPETVAVAHRMGLRIFGENRVEEAGPKATEVAALLGHQGGAHAGIEPPTWHMIGHVQSRKAHRVLPWASMVHSVDSIKLAERLDTASNNAGRVHCRFCWKSTCQARQASSVWPCRGARRGRRVHRACELQMRRGR